MKRFLFFLFVSFYIAPSLHAEYLGLPSSKARAFLQKQLKHPLPKQTASQLRWMEHLISLVYLERLMGNQKEAKRLFMQCSSLCSDLLLQREWRALLHWACEGAKTKKLPPICSKTPMSTR